MLVRAGGLRLYSRDFNRQVFRKKLYHKGPLLIILFIKHNLKK